MNLKIPSGDMEVLKALSSKPRQRILKMVSKRTPRMKDLSDELNMSTTAVIKHIEILEKANLVKTKVDHHTRGKPRITYPSEGIFAPDMFLPFLQKVFNEYPLMVEVVKVYEKTVGMNPPTKKDLSLMEENIERLVKDGGDEFNDPGSARGWFLQVSVLLDWCLVFLSHFGKKIPITRGVKKYPTDTKGVVVGYTFDPLNPGEEPEDIPNPNQFSPLILDTMLRGGKTPIQDLAFTTLSKYKERIPDLSEAKVKRLENMLSELCESVEGGLEKIKMKGKAGRLSRLILGDRSKEWGYLIEEMENCLRTIDYIEDAWPGGDKI